MYRLFIKCWTLVAFICSSWLQKQLVSACQQSHNQGPHVHGVRSGRFSSCIHLFVCCDCCSQRLMALAALHRTSSRSKSRRWWVSPRRTSKRQRRLFRWACVSVARCAVANGNGGRLSSAWKTFLFLLEKNGLHIVSACEWWWLHGWLLLSSQHMIACRFCQRTLAFSLSALLFTWVIVWLHTTCTISFCFGSYISKCHCQTCFALEVDLSQSYVLCALFELSQLNVYVLQKKSSSNSSSNGGPEVPSQQDVKQQAKEAQNWIGAWRKKQPVKTNT